MCGSFPILHVHIVQRRTRMIQRTKCRHYDVSNSRKPETRPNDHWQKKVVCSVCGIRVPGQKQLAQYMQSCTRHAKGCTYRFQDRYQWNIYMRRLQVSGDFKCDFPDCDIVYRDSGSLQHQVPSVHEGVRYKCDKCEDEFMSPKTLKVHEARDHDGQEPQYPCTESGCEKKYWTTTALGAHLITHTPSMHPVCPECGKSFYQEKGLKSHEVVHTNERPYKCHFCEADFKYTGNRLNDERSTHTQERPWVCWLCQFAFTRADQYTRHFSLHQLRDFNLSFPVEGCREMFVTPEALDAHLDSHAKEVQEMECVRPGRGWGRSLMEHKGQAHQEFPAPEHSSPDQK